MYLLNTRAFINKQYININYKLYTKEKFRIKKKTQTFD